MSGSVTVGSIELHPVPDAVGVLGEYGELYPEVPAAAWETYRALYPELFADMGWRVPCTCYLIRVGVVSILVDTGVGPPGLWDFGVEVEGLLPGALAALGVSRDDIDIVFLTHMHIDHVGWNTDLDGVPFFPRARYLVHPDSLAFARTQDSRPHVQRCILPLVDRFETVDRAVELVPGVSAFAAPGHYPGHMGLLLSSGGEEAVLIGDIAVHPALLANADWVYAADGDPAVCADTRRVLLPEIVDCDVLVVCGHYPGSGIGRVVRRDGLVRWEEAS